jgi:hypothetical protein
MSSEGGFSDVEAVAHYQVDEPDLRPPLSAEVRMPRLVFIRAPSENHAPDAAFLSNIRPSQEVVILSVDIQAYLPVALFWVPSLSSA